MFQNIKNVGAPIDSSTADQGSSHRPDRSTRPCPSRRDSAAFQANLLKSLQEAGSNSGENENLKITSPPSEKVRRSRGSGLSDDVVQAKGVHAYISNIIGGRSKRRKRDMDMQKIPGQNYEERISLGNRDGTEGLSNNPEGSKDMNAGGECANA